MTEPRHLPAGDGPAVWIGDSLHTVKLTGRDSGGATSMLEITVPPGEGPPPHAHGNEDETVHVLAGRLAFQLGDREVVAGPGDVVFIPRGTVHAVRNVGDEVGRTVTTYVPGGMDEYFVRAGTPAEPGSAPPPMTPERLRAAVELAPEYGMTIAPPPGMAGPGGPGGTGHPGSGRAGR
ncbi:Mannose-6-phosphate isomerase, cupin superfamily [Amycolatopsis arida]|uniref:Mannose-6-phosphate isomerase, cupin superfamily n=1 Tax=Amycolatopsis arida TaxID=587909 RepID=A0A1I6AK41_9PSEU|nr:cupin domain-containing protein [Amycolatopsis arida]TDX87340.1 mannose-6-phosphate isomerase-like protein (cupin superfamily) [Amycolatopsis arida]SFQ69058.1 Mannose-6-phosphate isomerase, cupin superfamily [Amycolatopsis arida]